MMKDQICKIVDTLCVPGPVALSATDFSFLDSCEDFNIYECCEDSVSDAVKLLSKYDFSGVKNLAVSICANEHDQHISVSEIGDLKDLVSNLDDNTNVLWGFGFDNVRTGTRKVTVLLAK